MNINELKVEKIALLLLTSFIIILFLDYCFGINNILYQNSYIDIKTIHKNNLYQIIFSFIIPLIYFIDRNEFEKISIETNGKKYIQNITSISIPSFILFVIGFLSYNITFLSDVNNLYKIIIIISIQFLIQITILDIIQKLISKCIKFFVGINNKIFNQQSKQKITLLNLINDDTKSKIDIINYINDNF